MNDNQKYKNAKHHVAVLKWLRDEILARGVRVPTVGDKTNVGWITGIEIKEPGEVDGHVCRYRPENFMDVNLGDVDDEYVKKNYMADPVKTLMHVVKYATTEGAWYRPDQVKVENPAGPGLTPMLLAFIDETLLEFDVQHAVW